MRGHAPIPPAYYVGLGLTNRTSKAHLLVVVDAGDDWTTLYRNAVPRVYRALLATREPNTSAPQRESAEKGGNDREHRGGFMAEP